MLFDATISTSCTHGLPYGADMLSSRHCHNFFGEGVWGGGGDMLMTL